MVKCPAYVDGQVPCLCGTSTPSSHKPWLGPVTMELEDGSVSTVVILQDSVPLADGLYRCNSVIADFDITA